jgi:hypothetical protein
MVRIFENPLNLSHFVLELRIKSADQDAKVFTDTADILDKNSYRIGTHNRLLIESILSDEWINDLLAIPSTPAEDQARTKRNNAHTEGGLASQFANLTPAQAVDYIETNVTNLASAKAVLKIMARVLIAMRNQVWPDL